MSARTASAVVEVGFTATITNTLIDGFPAQVALTDTTIASGTIATGTNANQANRAWVDRNRTLAENVSDVIDLYDYAGQDIGSGLGRDGLGLPLTIEEIVTIAVKHESGDGSLEIRPQPGGAGWTPIGEHTVANGGALKAGGSINKHQPHADGFGVTDGTNHLIRFTAVGGDLVYSVYVLGRHDDEESSSSSVSSESSSSSASSVRSSSSSASSVRSSSSSASSVRSSSSSSASSSSESSSSFSSVRSSSSESSASSVRSSSSSESSSSESSSSWSS